MELSDDEVAALGAGGFVMRDGLLGDTAAAAAAEARRLAEGGALRPAGVGREQTLDPATRGDAIAWLDEADLAPSLRPLWTCFEELLVALNRDAWLGLRRFEVQLAFYPGGGARYARHRDAFRGDDARVATAIVYLNPAWEPAQGGVLRLHTAAGPVDVEPLLDRLVLFLSERVEHEVLPAHAPRLAITAWYRRDLARL